MDGPEKMLIIIKKHLTPRARHSKYDDGIGNGNKELHLHLFFCVTKIIAFMKAENDDEKATELREIAYLIRKAKKMS